MLKYFEMFVNFLWGLPIIVIILGAGIYFTFKTGFFQVFYLKHIFSETILKTIKTGNKGEGNAKGLITPFDAVATAILGKAEMHKRSTARAVQTHLIFCVVLLTLVGDIRYCSPCN